MLMLFVGSLLVIGAGTAALCFLAHIRIIDAHEQAAASLAGISHYRPMLRLLEDEDIDPTLEPGTRGEVLARRRQLFREYLLDVGKDYGRLLARIRLIMVESAVDRPDLAKALLRHRSSFAIAMCRIEFRLRLHELGIGAEDLSGFADVINVLHCQVAALADTTVWGS